MFLSIYIYSLLTLFTLVISPFVAAYLCVIKILFSKRFFLKRMRRFISLYGYIIIKVLIYPFIRVSFVDEARDEKIAPCIFVCNHRSSSDPYMLALLPFEIVQVVGDWPFRIPILGLVAKLAKYINIKKISYNELEEDVERLIRQGVCVAVFPEGTRSGSKKMGQFHGALFRIALKMKCPVVPICIVGNENIPTRNFVLHAGKIKVKKLPAIYHDEYKTMTPFKFKNHVRNIIKKETARMQSTD